MDYNKEMEMIIEKLQTKPKLLLHPSLPQFLISILKSTEILYIYI